MTQSEKTDHIMQYFAYQHLPEHLQEISKPFCEIAEWMQKELPRNPERSAGLRKLLEAKDCAVRARLTLSTVVAEKMIKNKQLNKTQDDPALKYFSYEHLPEQLQLISKPFCELARRVSDDLFHDQEHSHALRKLLEAKDCAVRAKLAREA